MSTTNTRLASKNGKRKERRKRSFSRNSLSL
jgi:hypothetical protein